MLRFQCGKPLGDRGTALRRALQTFEDLIDGTAFVVAGLPCEVNPAFSAEAKPNPDLPTPILSEQPCSRWPCSVTASASRGREPWTPHARAPDAQWMVGMRIGVGD
jgi:hypothetical protein